MAPLSNGWRAFTFQGKVRISSLELVSLEIFSTIFLLMLLVMLLLCLAKITWPIVCGYCRYRLVHTEEDGNSRRIMESSRHLELSFRGELPAMLVSDSFTHAWVERDTDAILEWRLPKRQRNNSAPNLRHTYPQQPRRRSLFVHGDLLNGLANPPSYEII